MRKSFIYPVGIVLLLLFLTLPLYLPSYYLGLVILAMIWGIFAMSLDILLGYTGLPSFGHAALFGVAAYAVGVIDVRLLHNVYIQMIGGLCAALIIAAVFGLLAVRSRGIYFLMVTLALSMVLWGLASNWQGLTGGHDGLFGVSRPNLSPIPLNFSDANNFYYFVLLFFAVTLFLLRVIVRSPFGVALLGIRESETRMSVLGYNVWRYKYLSFIIAGTFAGLAGILFAYYNGFVHPSGLSVTTSAKVLIMTILGGRGTLYGPLWGAAIIVFLENFISAQFERWQMVLGAVYVIVVIFAPRGIYGPLTKLIKRAVRWNP